MSDFLKWFTLLFFLLAMPQSASAQLSEFNWQPRPMQSGEIANIVWSQSDPNTLYLGVEVNSHSFYKSVDGGKTWRLIDRGDHAKDVAVHPANPDIAFYSDSQSLWRTVSGGEQAVARPGPCQSQFEKCASAFQKVIESKFQAGPTGFSTIAIAPSNPATVYVGVPRQNFGPFGGSQAGGQLHRSYDGGAHFDELPGNYPGINVIKVDPNDPNKIFVGANEGIYYSPDGGNSLSQAQQLRAVVDIDTVDGKTLIAASEEGLYRSSDSGVSWQRVSGAPGSKAAQRARFAMSDPNRVWVTTTDGVFRSSDSGSNWEERSGNLPAKNLSALAVHPKNPNIALVATETFVFSIRSDGLFRQGQYYDQGIFRTEDGGASWQRSDQGIYEYQIEELTAHPTRPFEVWAGQQSSRGMYRSKDAGQSWSLSPGLLTHYPMRHLFSPSEPDTVYHTSSHVMEEFGVSTDSGVNWKITSESAFFKGVNAGKALLDESKTGGGNLHIHGLAVDPNNPKLIYAGSIDDPMPFNPKPLKGSHLFISTDGGTSWTESDSGFEHDKATSIHDIKIDPSNTQTIYLATTAHEATVGNGIWQSTDRAKTWHRSNSGMPDSTSVNVIMVHPKEGNRLLAGTEGGIYRSENGGESWRKVQPGHIWDIEYDPTNPEVVYAGSQTEGMFQSRDFGQSWSNVSGNLPSRRVSAIAVNSTGKIVYAGTHDKGLFVALDASVGEIAKDSGKTELGQGRGFGGEPGRGGKSPGGPGPPSFGPGLQPPPVVKAIVSVIVLGLVGSLVYAIVLKRRGQVIPKLFIAVPLGLVLVIVIAAIFAAVFIRRLIGQIPGGPGGQRGGPPPGFEDRR